MPASSEWIINASGGECDKQIPAQVGKATGASFRVKATTLRECRGSSSLPPDTKHLSFTINFFSSMEKTFAKAQAQLASRAAILLQIGAASNLIMNSWPVLGCLSFKLDSFCVEFDPKMDKPYDEAILVEALRELDTKIFQAKKDAQATISIIEAWGA